jgi:hypothetical protein
MLFLLSLFLLSFIGGTPQVNGGSGAERSTIVAARPEVKTRLVEENDHFLVNRLELAAQATSEIQQDKNDAVVIALGEGAALAPSAELAPNVLLNGEPRFLPAGNHPKILNLGGKPLLVFVVELKQHWDAEMRVCADLRKCTHPIRHDSVEVGQSTSLFSNGFVSAFRNRLASGRAVMSYSSGKGTQHLLLVPLADARIDFDGVDADLKFGDAYASDASAVEVNAGQHEVQWVVICMETPKK